MQSGLDYLADNKATISGASPFVHHAKGRPCILIFESPSTSSQDTSFYNGDKYLVHDYPSAPRQYWSRMRPVRYSAVGGDVLPVFMDEEPSKALLEHWSSAIPDFVRPTYTTDVVMDTIEKNPGE